MWEESGLSCRLPFGTLVSVCLQDQTERLHDSSLWEEAAKSEGDVQVFSKLRWRIWSS